MLAQKVYLEGYPAISLWTTTPWRQVLIYACFQTPDFRPHFLGILSRQKRALGTCGATRRLNDDLLRHGPVAKNYRWCPGSSRFWPACPLARAEQVIPERTRIVRNSVVQTHESRSKPAALHWHATPSRSPVGVVGAGATQSRRPGECPLAYCATEKSPKPFRLQLAHKWPPPGIPNDNNPPESTVLGRRKVKQWIKKERRINEGSERRKITGKEIKQDGIDPT